MTRFPSLVSFVCACVLLSFRILVFFSRVVVVGGEVFSCNSLFSLSEPVHTLTVCVTHCDEANNPQASVDALKGVLNDCSAVELVPPGEVLMRPSFIKERPSSSSLRDILCRA